MKKGRIFYRLFVALIILAGVGILFYPVFSDLWNDRRRKQLEMQYEEQIPAEDTEEYISIFEEAEEYNRQHTVNVISDAFGKEGEYILTHPYDALLNPNGDSIMGFVSIPRLRINVLIYHGIGQEALENGAGHVEGTSLPIGGESTHSVLAAHRGLPTAKLFTDLDQMTVGDKFFITVLNRKLTYQVDQIKVVLPSETNDLKIIPGEDHVTLLTCTPYGVNTHRLLVRGVRIPYTETDMETEAAKAEIINRNSLPTKALLIGLGVLAGLIILFLIIRKLQKRKE